MKKTGKQLIGQIEDLGARPERTIKDETGLVWTVSERKPSTKDADRSSSLLFVSDYSVRRVRIYPANWFQLSNNDLFAVSLGR